MLSIFELFQVSAQLVSQVFLCFGGWGWTTFVKHLQKQTMHLCFWKKCPRKMEKRVEVFCPFRQRLKQFFKTP